MVATVTGSKARVTFQINQLAKVEFLGHGATAIISIAEAVEDPTGGKIKQPLLVTGIPADAAATLQPTKLAAGDKVVYCTLTLAAAPKREGSDSFFTAPYGGRFILES